MFSERTSYPMIRPYIIMFMWRQCTLRFCAKFSRDRSLWFCLSYAGIVWLRIAVCCVSLWWWVCLFGEACDPSCLDRTFQRAVIVVWAVRIFNETAVRDSWGLKDYFFKRLQSPVATWTSPVFIRVLCSELMMVLTVLFPVNACNWQCPVRILHVAEACFVQRHDQVLVYVVVIYGGLHFIGLCCCEEHKWLTFGVNFADTFAALVICHVAVTVVNKSAPSFVCALRCVICADSIWGHWSLLPIDATIVHFNVGLF